MTTFVLGIQFLELLSILLHELYHIDLDLLKLLNLTWFSQNLIFKDLINLLPKLDSFHFG